VDATEILTLAVNLDHQGKGIGTMLMETLATTCPHTIFLEVAVDNAKAIRLYEKFGFKTISIRKNYYDQIQGAPLDAYLMKRSAPILPP
jgi:ribosomal-protein-alanine N-acetyltransferase